MTQTTHPLRATRLPGITIGADDFETLNELAMAATGDHTKAADLLFRELERAKVVPNHKLDKGIVRIGSFVSYTIGTTPVRRVQVVLPYLADISANRISVLTPIGAALIGLSQGQVIAFETQNGRRQTLQVASVEPEPPQ